MEIRKHSKTLHANYPYGLCSPRYLLETIYAILYSIKDDAEFSSRDMGFLMKYLKMHTESHEKMRIELEELKRNKDDE